MDAAARIQEAVQSFSTFFTGKPKVAEPPHLLNPIRHGTGEFEFQLSAKPGKAIELQISRDFQKWERLKTIERSSELVVISDRKAGEYKELFYRAVCGDLKSNYLGFMSVELPPGYSMISNPLQSPSHEIGALFPRAPEGTILSRFSLATGAMSNNKFEQGRWETPNDVLMAGEGALVRNPTDAVVLARFVGDVPKEPQSTPLQKGTCMRGPMLPVPGRLDTELNFPIAPGDVVSLYDSVVGNYIEFNFTQEGWAMGKAPQLRLGEAFWVAKSEAALWMQKLPEAGKK